MHPQILDGSFLDLVFQDSWAAFLLRGREPIRPILEVNGFCFPLLMARFRFLYFGCLCSYSYLEKAVFKYVIIIVLRIWIMAIRRLFILDELLLIVRRGLDAFVSACLLLRERRVRCWMLHPIGVGHGELEIFGWGWILWSFFWVWRRLVPLLLSVITGCLGRSVSMYYVLMKGTLEDRRYVVGMFTVI